MGIFNEFKKIRVYQEAGVPSLHKPVMLIIALSRCYHEESRLSLFSELDERFCEFFREFSLGGKSENSHYPFGKLENDGIWEIENSTTLMRTSAGHLFKKELVEKSISGGFSKEIYDQLVRDKLLIEELISYFFSTYFTNDLEPRLREFLNQNKNQYKDARKGRMALLNNNKFAVSRWWLSQGIEIVQLKSDIFSAKNLREAMRYFIAGSAVIKSINSWMVAIQVVERGKPGLTDFGMSLYKNDPKLFKSASWWSIHLSLCYSKSSDPYSYFFIKLDNLTKDWGLMNDLSKRIHAALDDSAEQSINSSLDGIKKMFQGDNPLAELGLVEINSGAHNSGATIRLGSPILSDEIFMHALALARFSHFKSRDSISFSELAATGLPNFLCCSKEDLRKNLQRMSSMSEWQRYFGFDYAVDLESITFKDLCVPNGTLLNLLQKGQDTWL